MAKSQEEQKMENDPNELLRRCFTEVGKKYRYDSVNAEFMEFRDFKIRWQRSYRWIDFRVSDYLQDAPKEILMILAEFLFKKILGDEVEYPAELRGWITSERFCESKQDMYLSRSRNLNTEADGESKNIRDAYERLIGAGLAKYDPSISFGWTIEDSTRKAAYCSVLMKVVAVTRSLDRDDVPDYVLDYVLYHELCHISIGFDPDGDEHRDRYRIMDERFPDRAKALLWLRRNSFYE